MVFSFRGRPIGGRSAPVGSIREQAILSFVTGFCHVSLIHTPCIRDDSRGDWPSAPRCSSPVAPSVKSSAGHGTARGPTFDRRLRSSGVSSSATPSRLQPLIAPACARHQLTCFASAAFHCGHGLGTRTRHAVFPALGCASTSLFWGASHSAAWRYAAYRKSLADPARGRRTPGPRPSWARPASIRDITDSLHPMGRCTSSGLSTRSRILPPGNVHNDHASARNRAFAASRAAGGGRRRLRDGGPEFDTLAAAEASSAVLPKSGVAWRAPSSRRREAIRFGEVRILMVRTVMIRDTFWR
jgi:hypothetical protein